MSSSFTATLSVLSTPEYSPPLAVWVRVSTSLMESGSWAPATVTVWAVSQLVEVKVSALLVSVAPLSVRSVPACPLMVTVTVTVGWVARLTA